MKHFSNGFILLLALLVCVAPAEAVCVNKYLIRSEGVKRSMTLLTGMLTFPEAQELSKAIRANKKNPLEWLDTNGKVIAKQIGDLKIVQPMPVSCGDKTSGVVMSWTFMSAFAPTKKVKVKIDAETIVDFDEQAAK